MSVTSQRDCTQVYPNTQITNLQVSSETERPLFGEIGKLRHGLARLLAFQFVEFERVISIDTSSMLVVADIYPLFDFPISPFGFYSVKDGSTCPDVFVNSESSNSGSSSATNSSKSSNSVGDDTTASKLLFEPSIYLVPPRIFVVGPLFLTMETFLQLKQVFYICIYQFK